MRRSLLLLLPILVVVGCPDAPEVPTIDPVPNVWVELEFTVDPDAVEAGDSAGYSAVMITDYGGRQPVDVDLSSDLESDLSFTAELLTPTVAGDHTITAAVVIDEQEFSATAPLSVWAGNLADLDLILDAGSAEAGAWTGYTVTGVDAWGNPVEVDEVEVTSDGELDITADSIRGTLVGSYTITASATGTADQESLEITPGPVDDVEITLSSGTLTAGGAVTWSASFWDAYGNEVTGVQSEVKADSADVTIAGTQITCTVADQYIIRIDVLEGSNPWDSAVLIVVASEAAGISLSLSPFPPEVQEVITASAEIVDAYGNETTASWTVGVLADQGSNPASVLLSGTELTFTEDGWFSVSATIDGTQITDETGFFLVDSFGPEIDIWNPPRGAWSTDYNGTVSGLLLEEWSGIGAATLNGNPITVDPNGEFSETVTYEFGINLLETLAVDGDGNSSSDRRSVLVGDFVPNDSVVGDGIAARLNQGSLDTLETLGEDLVASQDIAGMIPDPVFYDIDEYCVNIWPFGEVCYTLYELELRVFNPSLGVMDLEIDPQGSGAIYTSFTVHDVWVDWTASGVLSEFPYSANGSVSADSITISMNVWPSVNNGTISASVTDVSVSSAGFVFDFDSWIYDVAVWFGLDINGMVQGYVEDAIQSAVQDEVPGLLEDVLQDLEIGAEFEVMANTYHFLATPGAIAVDDDGITLSLDTALDPAQWVLPQMGMGSLYGGYNLPTYGATPGMVVSLSDDFLNQAMTAFWGGGLLEQEFPLGDLGIDPEDFDILPDNMADPRFVISGLLPPVVLPGTNGHLTDLQIGDLEISLYGDDPTDPANLALQLYMGMEAGLELSVTPNATLSASIVDADSWVDATYPPMPNNLETEFEDLLDLMLPSLTPLITDAIGEIPIPEISGFTLQNVSISASGPELGYVDAGGDLLGP